MIRGQTNGLVLEREGEQKGGGTWDASRRSRRAALNHPRVVMMKALRVDELFYHLPSPPIPCLDQSVARVWW